MEGKDGLIPQPKEIENSTQSQPHVRSEAEFWKGLGEIRDRRGSLTREHASYMYDMWKIETILGRQQDKARQVLIEAGITPETPLPKSIIGIDAAARGGSVVYDDLEILIRDIDRYFVLPSSLDAYTVAKDQIASATSPEVAEHMKSQVKPFTDEGIMMRLDKELRTWNEKGAQGRFRDSESSDFGGDAYKYSGGLFTGHEIGAYKDESGKYHLTLVGAGYSSNDRNPTDKIEDFAAFVDRDVTYGGAVDLTYVAAPPEQPEIKKNEDGTQTVLVDLSVKDIVEHIGQVTGLTAEQKQEFIREALVEPEKRDAVRPIAAQGLSIAPKVNYGRGDTTTYEESTGQLHFDRPVRITGKPGEDDSISFFLPRLYVNITRESPEAGQKAAKIFRAIETVSKNIVNLYRKNEMIRPDTWYYSTDRKSQSSAYS